MTTIMIYREDINNPIHPFMFDELCDQLGLDPRNTDEITMVVASASSDGDVEIK